MDDAMRKFNIRDISNTISSGKFRQNPHLFSVVTKRYPAGFVSRLHIHDFPQLWYCMEGNYLHQTATGTHSCCPGTLILVPPGCPDSFRIPERETALLTEISLSPALFVNLSPERYLNTLSSLFLPNYPDCLEHSFRDHVLLEESSHQTALEVLRRLSVLSCTPEKVPADTVLSQLETLFSLPEFMLPQALAAEAVSLLESRVFSILKALVFIGENYSRKLTVEELTRVSALCQTNFFRYFRTLTGTSFSTYLLHLRVSHVTFLIGNTDYSFSYISQLCGFSDPAHMTNAFTRCTGRPPRVGRPKLQAYYTDKKHKAEQTAT